MDGLAAGQGEPTELKAPIITFRHVRGSLVFGVPSSKYSCRSGVLAAEPNPAALIIDWLRLGLHVRLANKTVIVAEGVLAAQEFSRIAGADSQPTSKREKTPMTVRWITPDIGDLRPKLLIAASGRCLAVVMDR
jgi:hypothetical protein